MNTESTTSNLRLWVVAKWTVALLLGYWFFYAVVAPVTIWDAHTYNLARLLVIRLGGFFGNTVCNTERQIAWPWAFDAVHYPFVLLGWGYVLPSFACFAGLMLIVFRLVKATYGEESAWFCCLAMLALPTVMFQASSAKNDLVVVFCVGCWCYALWRFQQAALRRFLFLAALSLSFAAGAKTMGLALFVILSGYTLWRLRSNRNWLLWFAGCWVVCTLLFASVETYVNNQMRCGRLLGTLSGEKNPDGLAGMSANVIRYTFGSVNIGVDVANHHGPFARFLENACRDFLSFTGLQNKGYRTDFNDSNLQFFKDGGEAGSDYEPIGTIGMVVSLILLFTRPVTDRLWKISLLGFASLLLICVLIAWMPWNMRFLMLPFLLWTLAATIYFTAEARRAVVCRRLLFTVAAFSAFAFPYWSHDKGPADLWSSLVNRDAITTKERPGMLPVIRGLRARQAQIGGTPFLLCANGDSWVLPILQMRGLKVILTPQIDLARIQEIAKKSGRDSLYILALNRRLGAELNLAVIETFPEDTALLQWHAPPAGL